MLRITCSACSSTPSPTSFIVCAAQVESRPRTLRCASENVGTHRGHEANAAGHVEHAVALDRLREATVRQARRGRPRQARTCEYGPTAEGALSDATTSFFVPVCASACRRRGCTHAERARTRSRHHHGANAAARRDSQQGAAAERRRAEASSKHASTTGLAPLWRRGSCRSVPPAAARMRVVRKKSAW